MTIYLDISPLLEQNWTGLAVVTKNLAEQLLRSASHNVKFFVREQVISNQFVQRALDSPGKYLSVFIDYGHAVEESLWSGLKRENERTIGIFPNIKPFHRVFDFEVLIAHDLSFMLCPEMHTLDTTQRHSRAFQQDTASSDLICCVSEATRQDLLLYMGYDPERAFVSHLGADTVRSDEGYDFSGLCDRFIVVLGTVEPRKNLKMIADLLKQFPHLTDSFTFVIVGRSGWGAQLNTIFDEAFRHGVDRSKVISTGFVSNSMKRALLRNAAFAIFPSIFEGFGLPVVEAMAAGCPTLVSISSSLVELGVPRELQFDPLSVTDFAYRFAYVSSMGNTERQELAARLRENTEAKFKWEYFAQRILDKLV